MISTIVCILGCFIRFVLSCLGALFLLALNYEFGVWFLKTCNGKDSEASVTNDDRLKQQQPPQQPSESAAVWRLVFELVTSNNDGVIDAEDHDLDAESKDDPVRGGRRRSHLQNGHRCGRNLTHVMTFEYVEMNTEDERRHQPKRSRDEMTSDPTQLPENSDRANAKDSSVVESLRQTFLSVDADVWNRSFRARSLPTISSSSSGAAAVAGIVLSFIELAENEASQNQSVDGVAWPPKPGEKVYWTLDIKKNMQSSFGRQTQLQAVYWITLEKVVPTVNSATPEVTSSLPDPIIIYANQFPQPTPPQSEKRSERETPTLIDEGGPLTAFTQDLTDDVIVNQIDDEDNNLKPIGGHSHLDALPDPPEFIGH